MTGWMPQALQCVNAVFEDAVILVMLEPADKDCAHRRERNPCSALQPRGFEHPPCLCVVAVNGADHGVRDLPGRGRTAEIRRMQQWVGCHPLDGSHETLGSRFLA